jgi:hypothetical protein
LLRRFVCVDERFSSFLFRLIHFLCAVFLHDTVLHSLLTD